MSAACLSGSTFQYCRIETCAFRCCGPVHSKSKRLGISSSSAWDTASFTVKLSACQHTHSLDLHLNPIFRPRLVDVLLSWAPSAVGRTDWATMDSKHWFSCSTSKATCSGRLELPARDRRFLKQVLGNSLEPLTTLLYEERPRLQGVSPGRFPASMSSGDSQKERKAQATCLYHRCRSFCLRPASPNPQRQELQRERERERSKERERARARARARDGEQSSDKAPYIQTSHCQVVFLNTVEYSPRRRPCCWEISTPP